MQTQTQLQNRLDQLEKQLARQQWTNVALLMGALIAVGATRVVSQNSTRELSVQTLKIVGKDGRVKAILTGDGALNASGGALFLFDNKGNPTLAALSDAKGASVSLLDEKAAPRAVLGYDGDGGLLGLSARNSKAKVDLAASKALAGVVVSGPNGAQSAVIGGDNSGGMAEIYDAGGKLKKF